MISIRKKINIYCITLLGAVAAAGNPPQNQPGEGNAMELRREKINAAEVFRAPYVWQEVNGSIDACMPGAYLRFAATDSDAMGVVIDRSANRACPAISMPMVEFFVDGGPVKTFQIPPPADGDADEFVLIFAENLDPAQIHTAEIHFRSANLMLDRWSSPLTHLRLSGVLIGRGAQLSMATRRSRLAIGFGDSITEGIGAAKPFTGWHDLSASRAQSSWFPLACAALDCEYGQLGTGGQGLVNGSEKIMPPLLHTWSRYSATASRLNDDGLLLPEPDLVFCAMGTNDFYQDITEPRDIEKDAEAWLRAVRSACPAALIFWLIPPLGMHEGEIFRAVVRLREEGDERIFCIDTAPFRHGYDAASKPSRYADDGVHPNAEGAALLGALAAATVRAELAKMAQSGETQNRDMNYDK